MARPVLLLDVMDTLVADPFWSIYPQYFGSDLKALLKVKNPDAWPRFERGEIDEETYFRTAFTDGRPFDGPGLREAIYEGYRFFDGAEALLAELQEAGVEMHYLSNYPVWYRRLDDKLGLSRYAPWTFVSWKTGVRKPDPAAYLGAAEHLGRPPEELLFVDDRERNTQPATELGLDTVLFESIPRLREELRQRGVL